MVIINVHAPTEEKGNYEKKELYVRYFGDIYYAAAGSIKIIVGDLNAKVGRESEYRDWCAYMLLYG